jgi:hypothetical protein
MNVTVERVVGPLYTPYSDLRRKNSIDVVNDLFWIISNHEL